VLHPVFGAAVVKLVLSSWGWDKDATIAGGVDEGSDIFFTQLGMVDTSGWLGGGAKSDGVGATTVDAFR
jgi:hypothetical protein